MRLLIRHQRLVHLVLAQFQEVALELRQVAVPWVLAHLSNVCAIERLWQWRPWLLWFSSPAL